MAYAPALDLTTLFEVISGPQSGWSNRFARVLHTNISNCFHPANCAPSKRPPTLACESPFRALDKVETYYITFATIFDRHREATLLLCPTSPWSSPMGK